MKNNSILKADGQTVPFAAPSQARKGYPLEALKGAIGGGWIEIVRIPKGMILVIDEEGLLKGMPFNRAASQLAGQPIVGDALLCSASDVK